MAGGGGGRIVFQKKMFQTVRDQFTGIPCHTETWKEKGKRLRTPRSLTRITFVPKMMPRCTAIRGSPTTDEWRNLFAYCVKTKRYAEFGCCLPSTWRRAIFYRRVTSQNPKFCYRPDRIKSRIDSSVGDWRSLVCSTSKLLKDFCFSLVLGLILKVAGWSSSV